MGGACTAPEGDNKYVRTRFSLEKLKGTGTTRKTEVQMELILKLDLREMELEDMDWTHLAQDMDY